MSKVDEGLGRACAHCARTIRGANYFCSSCKVARQFGIPQTAQAKYIIIKELKFKELKSMLASVLEK